MSRQPQQTRNGDFPHIGELRQRITFQRFTEVSDGIGGRTKTYEDLPNIPTVFAVVRPASNGERFFAEKLEHTVTHVIRIRYRSDLDTSMRILFQGREFEIKQIVDMYERKQFLRIEAVEGVGS